MGGGSDGQESKAGSAFSDEFYTQAASENDMDHFDTDDEYSKESGNQSGFPDEFSTQTADGRNTKRHDTDQEESDIESSSRQQLEVPTPTPLSGNGTPRGSKARNVKTK